MNPPYQLRLAWLADALRVPFWSRTPSGVTANAVAIAMGCGGQAEAMAASIQALPGLSLSRDRVEKCLLEALRAPQSVGAGKWTLIVIASGADVEAMAVPSDYARMGELYRRAAVADATAGVAHELSNALGAIAGWVELAADRPDAAPAQRVLEAIRESASAARDSADGLLGMARPDDEVAAQDVYELLRQVLTVAQPQARKVGASLELIGEAGAMVSASRSDLFTIFWNIVKNAVEALGAPGRVVVTMRRRDGQVQVEIQDDGPGIAENERERVFDRYVTSKSTGSGVGLALVREAVSRAKGSIRISGAQPRGTVFHLRFPIAMQVEVPELEEGRSSWSPTPAGFHVLVVDDDLAMRDLIGTTYTLRGAEVTLAETVAEIEGRDDKYDLALVDLHVGAESGQELLEGLLVSGRVRVACLMSGGEPPATWPTEALNLGWIRKPFELEELHELLKRAILVTRAPT